MKVRDAMAKTVKSARKHEKVGEVAKKMKQEKTGFIPVVEDGGRLVGVITDRDIVIRCIAEEHELNGETIEHVMTMEITTISPEETLEAAALQMENQEIRRLVVVEDGRLVGVLSHGNLVQALKGRGAAEKATVGVTRGA